MLSTAVALSIAVAKRHILIEINIAVLWCN